MMQTRIEHEALRQLVPHSERMCLLEYVDGWSEDWIVCGSTTHRQPDNPLLRDGLLSVVHAAEYGAQAMAVHGGLLHGLLQQQHGVKVSPGYLAALRDVNFYVMRLDNIKGDLRVKAARLIATETSLMYEFEVTINEMKILDARATVITANQ